MAAVYRRYGGSVDGEVIRLDLMARGLLEIIEERTPYHTARKWKSNPIRALTDSWVLISEQARPGLLFLALLHPGPEHSFERYSLHAGMVRSIKPAGPPPWSIPPAEGVPQAATITGRYGGRGGARPVPGLRLPVGPRIGQGPQEWDLSTPVLRAMEKAVPLDKGPDLRLPDPHGFFFRAPAAGGCGPDRRGQGIGRSRRDDAADRPVRPLAGAHWARGWLSTRDWFDGYGTPTASERENYATSVWSSRQVLAWALGCLARAGDHWYNLTGFVETLYATSGILIPICPAGTRRGTRVFRAAMESGHDGPRSPAGVVVSVMEGSGSPTP